PTSRAGLPLNPFAEPVEALRFRSSASTQPFAEPVEAINRTVSKPSRAERSASTGSANDHVNPFRAARLSFHVKHDPPVHQHPTGVAFSRWVIALRSCRGAFHVKHELRLRVSADR